MNDRTRSMRMMLLAVAMTYWSSGCNRQTASSASSPPTNENAANHSHDMDQHSEGGAAMKHDHPHDAHHDGAHAEGEHKDGLHNEGDHHSGALTASDVQMPESFKAGVERLEKLHQQISQLAEQDGLANVHRVAEEMALVAKKMKELARAELPEEKQTEAGRLCNAIAGYFAPIDEVADAGKKKETLEIHTQMADTIMKLKALVE